jgi:hypothetical protein
LFKAALEIIVDHIEMLDGKTSDEVYLPYINEIISFLIVLPDDPEGEYLALYDGVSTAISLI